jgi:integration host factor subunit alpha
MTLNKAGIARSVMENVGFKRRRKGPQLFLFPELDRIFLSRERADAIVGSLFEKIKYTLARGQDVLITGFGKFQVKFRWARKGRNPQTGETIIIRSSRTVTFKVSRKLREKMNLSE